jgi:hypothetical protein
MLQSLYTTIRIWRKTRQPLRTLAALLDMNIPDLIHSLVSAELKRLGIEQ